VSIFRESTGSASPARKTAELSRHHRRVLVELRHAPVSDRRSEDGASPVAA